MARAAPRRAASNPSPAPETADLTLPSDVAAVVAAARSCFARFGVHRARMEDVASEAGMARSRVYKIVSSKEELVELALLENIREYAERLRRRSRRSTRDVAEALVAVMVSGIIDGRSDQEYAYLADAMPRVRLQYLLTGVESPIHRMSIYAFEPLFERARSEGRLRDTVTEQDIVHWLAIVISVLTPSEDINERSVRELLRKFVLPAVFSDPS